MKVPILILILLALVFDALPAHSQNQAADKRNPEKPNSPEPTAAEKREAAVYEGIGNMIVSRDELLKRYAVLMEGVYFVQRPGAPPKDEMPFQLILAQNGTSFQYRAVNYIRPNINGGEIALQTHLWQEWFEGDGGVIKARSLPGVSPYMTKPEGTLPRKWFAQLRFGIPYLVPFDQFAGFASSFKSTVPGLTLEECFLQRCKLTGTEDHLGGTIRSHWEDSLETEWTHLTATITHNPRQDYMPIEVEWKNKKERDFSHMRLDWKKQQGMYLPYRIEFVVGSSSAEKQNVILLHWAVGKDATDELFDPAAEDLRQPIMDHFGKEFTRIVEGQMIPTAHYTPPESLYDDHEEN